LQSRRGEKIAVNQYIKYIKQKEGKQGANVGKRTICDVPGKHRKTIKRHYIFLERQKAKNTEIHAFCKTEKYHIQNEYGESHRSHDTSIY